MVAIEQVPNNTEIEDIHDIDNALSFFNRNRKYI